MKGDPSRKTFEIRKSYRRVVEQQGRVQLDSEFKEEHDIAHYFEARIEAILGSSDNSPNQKFELPRVLAENVANIKVYIDEAGHIAKEEILELMKRKKIQEISYSNGTVEAVWVRWNPQKKLVSDSRFNRSYRIQRRDGSTYVMFGDGVKGAVPPTGTDNIKATYRIGVGVDGNLEMGVLTSLVSTSPQVRIKFCGNSSN